ncbi:peptide ABC transporter ATPase [Clostridium tetanomorphum]|nr:peptide ABC transporter ATPase [Clostridium tetanomorphum]
MPPGEIKKESQILFEGKDILKMSDKELRQLEENQLV